MVPGLGHVRFFQILPISITVPFKVPFEESLGNYGLRKHKPWFDKGRSKLLDQRKQAKLQWLLEPVKPVDISGIKRGNILKLHSLELADRSGRAV
jgi:hypothetical protein